MRVLEEKIGYAEQVFRELATMTERVYAIYEPMMACVKQANGLLRSLSTKSREIEAYVKGNVATMNALISPVNAAVLRLYEKFPGSRSKSAPTVLMVPPSRSSTAPPLWSHIEVPIHAMDIKMPA